VPLSEIAPDFKCPKTMEAVNQILVNCSDKTEVKKYQLNAGKN
jgi:hypothetical protein